MALRTSDPPQTGGPASHIRSVVRRPRVLRDLRRLDRMARFGDADVVFGNGIDVFPGGRELYDAMLEAIETARRSITIEMYTWADDRVGERFARAIRTAARRGVTVFVLLDAFGSLGSEGLAAAMHEAGARVRWYNRLLTRLSRWFPNRRDHRKLLIADGASAFLGGINLAECYTEEFAGQAAWRDLAIRIRGPAVRELVRLFAGTWARAGGTVEQAAATLVHVPDRGSAGVQVLGHVGTRGRRALRRGLLSQVAMARERILVASGYFAPDPSLRRALCRAARGGIRVQLLLPGSTDVPAVRWAGRAMYGRLLGAGVLIRELTGAVLHTKAAVFDERIVTVGSANLDARSFHHNVEVCAYILDRDAARRVTEILEADSARAVPVELEAWRRRRFSERVLEAVGTSLRHWL